MTDAVPEPAVAVLERLVAALGDEECIAEVVRLDSRRPGECWGGGLFDTVEAEFRHRTLAIAAEVRRAWGPFNHEAFIDAAVSLFGAGGLMTAAWRRGGAVAYVTLRHPPVERAGQDPRAHFLVVLGAVPADDVGVEKEGPGGEPAVASLRPPSRRSR
jgi:hypothetical protein